MPKPEPRKEPARPGEVKLIDLDAEACRFPFGDPKDKAFGFCGITKRPGSPYCADHHRIAFNPNTKKVR